MSWFQVDDHINDSPELLSIPRTHRLPAMGVWVLCGSYVADQLTDGFIPDDIVKRAGAYRNKIRAYLVAAGFWVEVPGGVELQPLYCRWQSSADALQSRYATGRRIANYRARRKQASSEPDASEMQAACKPVTNGHVSNGVDLGKHPNVTPLPERDAGNGIGNGGSNDSYLPNLQSQLLRKSGTALESAENSSPRQTMDISRLCGNEPAPLEPPPADRHVPPEATALVKAAVPDGIWRNQKTRWGLVTQTATLLNNGSEPCDVQRALARWVATDDVRPGHLPHILTDVLKEQTPRNGNGPLRGAGKKAADWQALKRGNA